MRSRNRGLGGDVHSQPLQAGMGRPQVPHGSVTTQGQIVYGRNWLVSKQCSGMGLGSLRKVSFISEGMYGFASSIGYDRMW